MLWGFCLFRYAWLPLFFCFGRLASYGVAGLVLSLYVEADAFTYLVIRLMTCSASRNPEFSTVEARYFWQTETQFAASRFLNSRLGSTKMN